MIRFSGILLLLPLVSHGLSAQAKPPIYISFLWHMHQPVYYPGESAVQTDVAGRYAYSIADIHNQRRGPYTTWPWQAVQKGIAAGLPHFGAQVSFSGSLIRNLDAFEAAGNANFQSWRSSWLASRAETTALGNPRLDLVGFGFHHPLMPLLTDEDIRAQIREHRTIFASVFPGPYSRGIFPPENAFSPRIIPSLVAEGLRWVLVDNIHLDRAAEGYPYNSDGNLYEPNPADQRNPNPGDWVSLTGLWAPTKTSAAWGRRPHYVEYVDPASGAVSRIIAVPADRYMGNEDGRGGFGALNYEAVMSQMEASNTDPTKPILIVLHHDGDNYGGGTDAYYGSNFQSFVDWLLANPTRFVCTTIEDYLEMFPPDPADVIHVEDGSWSGADNGDPEFLKWNGDPVNGYSPDRNSWGIVTAAQNAVETAEAFAPNDPGTLAARAALMNAQASDYWYWDGSQGGIWDSHPARASNIAWNSLIPLLASAVDAVGPSISHPQRDPYNPGGTEWGVEQPSTLAVRAFIYDLHGVKRAEVKWRIDLDGVNAGSNAHNETYAGGSDVTAWTSVPMTPTFTPSQTDPAPLAKAYEYAASLSGLTNALVDYFIEAEDSLGNVRRSAIMHVWVGGASGGAMTGVSWTPLEPTRNDTLTITVTGATKTAKLHWGVNNQGSTWQSPHAVTWPAGSALFQGTGPAVESPFAGPDPAGTLTIRIGPFDQPGVVVNRVAFVIHYDDNTWDNNGGEDYHIEFPAPGGSTGSSFVMDGQLDAGAVLVGLSGGLTLHAAWSGSVLYVATPSAGSQGGDLFIFVSDSARSARPAPWAKAGMVSGWAAYLAGESANSYCSWYDQAGSVQSAAGTVLEGTIDLAGEFGFVPSSIFLAVGKYQTQDGGALVAQIPAGNGDGTIDVTEWVTLTDGMTSAADEAHAPRSHTLLSTYPNPFNGEARIVWMAANSASGRVTVHDLLGRGVGTIFEGMILGGRTYEMRFDASRLLSGVYVVRLEAGKERRIVKMVLAR
jgi:hypothetical protein